MQITWNPTFGSIWLVLLAFVIVFLLLYLVRPQQDGLTPSRQRWLLGLRSGGALILLLAMLRPTMVRTTETPVPATLAVLLDGSSSMSLPSGDGRDRWTVQSEVWNKLLPSLQGRDEMLDVQVFQYAQKASPLTMEAVSDWLSTQPTGRETDLSIPLQTAVSQASGRPLAGVVMVGDGTQTSRAQGGGAQQSARLLAALEVPLWTVPIGQRRGDETERDVEITDVPESLRLFSGNSFKLPVTIRTQSLAGADIPVRVRWVPQALDTNGQPNAPIENETSIRSVVPRTQSDSQAMEFSLEAPAPGRYQLEVSADNQAGEALTINNQQIAFVDVREGGGRILYLEGEPREEQLRLRLALRRFPDLELVYQWIRRDTESTWPVDLSASLQPDQFDIYILGDLHAKALGNEQLELLQKRVAEGAGLMMLGGLNTYDEGGYAQSPLAEVLPIQLSPEAARPVDSPPSPEMQIQGPVPLRVVRNHPLVQIGDTNTPQATFDQLPPLTGANRFTGIKAIPGVQVLLESDQKDPLLVVGEYGNGRVVTFAGDSTWQWWRKGASLQHRRFWRQIMLWLMARDTLSDDAIAIELEGRRFAVDATPSFTVRARFSQSKTLETPLIAELVDSAGTVTSLPVIRQPAADGEAIVSGKLSNLSPGIYRLRASAGGEASPLKPDEIAFQVIDNDREKLRPIADPAFLEQLADLTGDAGGQAFAVDELEQLIDAINRRRSDAALPITKQYRLGNDPGTGWLLFLLFAGCLGTDWALRRRWGLA